MSALFCCILRRSWERFNGILSPLALSEMILTRSLSPVGGVEAMFRVIVYNTKDCQIEPPNIVIS